MEEKLDVILGEGEARCRNGVSAIGVGVHVWKGFSKKTFFFIFSLKIPVARYDPLSLGSSLSVLRLGFSKGYYNYLIIYA